MDESANQDPVATAAIAAALGKVDGLADRHLALQSKPRDAGSLALQDVARSAKLGPEVEALALDQLSSSLDHLNAWYRLVTVAQTQPIYSHLTLIRGAMEATVTARWLLDPKATVEDRVGRAAALLWYDHEERKKAERDLKVPVPQPPGKTGALRQAELESDRLADHLQPIGWPGHTKLVGLYGIPSGASGIGFYRILSANAHARRWRLLLNPIVPIEPSFTGTRFMRVSASDDIAQVMTASAVAMVESAIGEAESYRAGPVLIASPG